MNTKPNPDWWIESNVTKQGPTTFTPPPAGWLVLQVDGGFQRRSSSMGCGGFIRDHVGAWVIGFASFEGHGEAFLAELLAVIRGLTLAWQQGIRKLLCFSDCMEVVKALTDNRSHNLYSHAAYLAEARDLIHQDWEVSLHHLPREQNAPADALASLGVRLSIAFTTWSAPPPEIMPLMGCG